MRETQMSWLHNLVNDRGSAAFIVILKAFLKGSLFFFSLWSGSTCLKMESVICCCTTVPTYEELHSELTLFSCLTGFSLPLVLFTPVLPLCRLLSYVSLNRPGKHCNSLPVQAEHSTPKFPTVGLLTSRLCGIKAYKVNQI